MKKIIFILIIIAVLLFSGCDAMLEFFYPDFAAENEVTVNVTITISDITLYNYNTTIPLYIELYKSGETPSANTPVRSILKYNEFGFSTTLFVPEGSYDLYIWQDSDLDGGYSITDFRLDGAVPSKVLSGTEDNWIYNATSWTDLAV
jgi:hypothetical protein